MSDAGGDAHSAEEAGPGTLLAREREARGLTIADLSGRLKYSHRQITALEADDFSKLPGGTFVRGMIRAYAKQVGVDQVRVMELFDKRHATVPVAVDIQARRIPFPDGKKKATRVYLVLSSLALIAVGAVLLDWHFGAEFGDLWKVGRSSAPSVTIAKPKPPASLEPADAANFSQNADPDSVSRPAVGEGRPTGSVDKGVLPLGKIVMEFQRDSWVEVTDAQGALIMSQLNPAGSSKSIEASPPLSLTIGNAQGVKLTFNDAPVDLKPYVKVDVARLTLE